MASNKVGAGGHQSEGVEGEKIYTKKEIEQFISDIGRRVVDSNTAYMHSLLALNTILRQPNLSTLIDDELREEMKDIWVKLMKSTGLQLVAPPILFGIPDGMLQWESEFADGVDGKGHASS